MKTTEKAALILGKFDLLLFSRFVLVGILNTILGNGIIYSCMYFVKLSPEISNAIGYVLGTAISYSLHRRFTFRSSQDWRKEVAKFLPVFGISFGLNFVSLVVLIRKLHISSYLGQMLAAIIYVASSFILNRYLVFARKGSKERNRGSAHA